MRGVCRVSFRIFVKGGKRDNHIIQLSGGKIVLVFLSAKNNIVFINLFVLGGLGHAPPGKIYIFNF